MKINLKRGFTLIELLVVIAIIGILASVVLASLNSARAKGQDAATKSAMSNLRSQAELYFSGTRYYTSPGNFAPGSCIGATGTNVFADPQVQKLLVSAAGSPARATRCAATHNGATNPRRWAVAIELKTANGTATGVDAFCVDSSGSAKEFSYTSATNPINGAITNSACN